MQDHEFISRIQVTDIKDGDVILVTLSAKNPEAFHAQAEYCKKHIKEAIPADVSVLVATDEVSLHILRTEQAKQELVDAKLKGNVM